MTKHAFIAAAVAAVCIWQPSAAGRNGTGAESAPPLAQDRAQIAGRLLEGHGGRPLSGRIVFIQVRQGKTAVVRGVRVGADGGFILRDLEPGPITLTGIAEGYGTASIAVNAYAAETATDDVVLAVWQGGNLTGVVVDSFGKPVPDADVTIDYLDRPARNRVRISSTPVVFMDGPWYTGTTRTRIQGGELPGQPPGAFDIRGVDPQRRFRVRASHAELGIAESNVMVLDSGETAGHITLALKR